jgi:outer membrane protein TolC
MKLTNIAISIVLVTTLAVPALASKDWVEDFLRRYDPKSAPAPTANPSASLGQFLRTGEVPVTLNDVINMLIDNNLDIRSNRLTPRSSYYQSLVFYRALLPSLRFSANMGRDVVLSTTQLNGATSRIQDTGNFAVNFSQLLPSGTSLAVDMTMQRLLTNSNNSIYNPSYTGRLTYTVGQHLMRDRGRIINMRQIVQGQNNEKIAELAFEIQLTSLLVQAQKSYWDLVFAGQDLVVKQRSLDLANQTLDENKTKVEIGTLAPIDVIQTQADVAARRDLLVQSTYSVTTAEDQIKKMISMDKDPSMFLVKLRTQETPIRPEAVQVPTLEEAVKIALENRPEMRQSELDLKNKDIDVQYTANQKKPIVDVTGSFSQNGTGGTQRRGFTLGSPVLSPPVPGGVFDSIGQVFGYGYTGFSGGFSVTIPLNNKAAIADFDRANNEQRLSQSKMDVTAQGIALDVRNAMMQVEMNRARIETAKATRELAQKKMEAEQEKFNLGTSTLRFVLEEQRNVAQAESSELQTEVNFTKSLVDLDRAMGLTIKKNNIGIEKTLNPTALDVRRIRLETAN